MLEEGVNPSLCRNGNSCKDKSDQQQKSLEQEPHIVWNLGGLASKREGINVSVALALETADFQPFYERPPLTLVPDIEQTTILSELAEDEAIRREVTHFVGVCLADREVSLEYLPKAPVNSLLEAMQRGVIEVVETNVSTDMVERTLKSGHVTEVKMTVEDNIIHQGGHSLYSIQANNLLFSADSEKMKPRSYAEARNTFRITGAYEAGKLEDSSVVVISRTPDNMTTKEMKDVGFFTDTMSVSIQVTRLVDGKLVTESAFVAGVARPGDERHDTETIATLGDVLGVDLHDKTAVELIDAPLLIPNSLIPNGVIDLVELYDECANEDVFFGEAKPKQDYLTYREECRTREARLKPIVDDIVTELLDSAPHVKTEVEACELLADLSEKHMVVQAVNDVTINPLVFGEVAAPHIMEARYYMSVGDSERANSSIASAKDTAVSSSCPTARASAMANQAADNKDQGAKNEDADKYGSLEFTCGKGHWNRRPRNRLIDRCRTCGISVRC